MTDAGNATGRGLRQVPRWLLGLLLVSLAVNLVVAGSVAGAVWRHRSPPSWSTSVVPNLLGFAGTLPAERRRQLWQDTAEERGHIRPFRRAVRAAREETMKALLAEPFDRQRFLAAQARQAEAENHARDVVRDLYVKIAERLTPEERRAFPRWREHRRLHGPNLLDEPDHQAGEPKTR